MRVMVTGAGGLLAHAVRPALGAKGHEVRAYTRAELDVTDERAFAAAATATRPDWIFHLAAMTKVDACESGEGRALATRVNVDGSRNAARAAEAAGAALLAISSDYVFDGRGRAPYREGDPTGPISAYGSSKLAGEEAIRQSGVRHLLVRTAWLFGRGGKNFVDTILARARAGQPLQVVADQTGSPTLTPDLAEGLVRLAERAENGTYHVVNGGAATWHELASAAVEAAGLTVTIEKIATASLGLAAQRPAYSVLDSTKFTKATGILMPHWRDAVARHVRASREAA